MHLHPILWIKVHNKIHNHYTYAWIVKIITFSKMFFLSLYNIKMAKVNIWFHENDDQSYDMLDLRLNNNKLFGYKDSYYYYDIDVKKY